MPKEKKYIPELRFPEFKKRDGWNKERLGAIANFSKGKGLPKKDIVKGGKNPCLHYGELFTEYSEIISDIISYTNEDGDIKSEINDVLMPTSDVTPTGLATASCIKVKDVILGGDILIIKSDSSRINGEYLSRYINSKKQGVLRFVTGSTVYHLYASTFERFKVYFPKIDEQQKIADCLSSLDRLITFEKERLDALKDHKKGLLQSLFPAKGKKVPERRFPEFEKDGEWEEKKFDGMFDLLVTNSLSRAKLNYESGDVKNIHYGDIHTEFSILFNIEKEKVPFINKRVPIDKIREEAYCKEGDLIFADASEDIKDIGKVIEIVNLNNVKLVSGLHTIHARQKTSKLIIGFGAYLFSSETIKNKIRREAQGAKVLGLSKKGISRIRILFPTNKKEQQNIFNLLSSVHFMIENQNKKIKSLEEHKKGLMQKLFPKL